MAWYNIDISSFDSYKQISRLGDFTRSDGKTSYRMLEWPKYTHKVCDFIVPFLGLKSIFVLSLCDYFTYVPRRFQISTRAILSQYQWNNPEGYVLNNRYLTTKKHNANSGHIFTCTLWHHCVNNQLIAHSFLETTNLTAQSVFEHLMYAYLYE